MDECDHNPGSDRRACFFRRCGGASIHHRHPDLGGFWMRVSVVLAAALATAAATAAPAPGATTYTPGSIVTASTPTSPFVDPCPHQAENPPDQVNFKDTEVEPLVAVNPTDQDNVIGVYQEDRWSDGGAHGLLAATSFTGGGSSPHTSWAGFSSCSDKPETDYFEHLPRATDPWVSFDSAGRAYQIGLSIIDGSLEGENALSTSYSDDGGLTWSDPSLIDRQDPTD